VFRYHRHIMKPVKLVAIFALVVAVLIGGFSIAIAAVTAPLSLPDTPATLEIESDGVEVKRADTDDWIAATNGLELQAGDAIRTDATGLASVNLFDQGVVRLDVNTEVTLTEALWDAETPDTFVGSVFLETGRLWSRLFDFVSPESAFEVETESTVATVRGTIFSVTALPDGEAWVYVDEHAVHVRGKANNGGKTVDAGSHASVKRDANDYKGSPSPYMRVTVGEAESMDLKAWIERNREKDRVFERDVHARMRQHLRGGGSFTDLAERVRLALTSDQSKRDVLDQRFRIRRSLLDRLELRDALPEIRVRDDAAVDTKEEPSVTTEIDTSFEILINGEPVETWSPIDPPATEPVTEPIVEPAPEPVVTNPLPVEEPIVEPTGPTPSHLVVQLFKDPLMIGEQTTLRALLVYTDDSYEDVSADVNWSVYDDVEMDSACGSMALSTFIAESAGTCEVEAMLTLDTKRYRDSVFVTVYQSKYTY